MTAAVLGGTGLVSGVGVAVLAAMVWSAAGGPALVGRGVAVLVLAALAADAVFARTGRLRPLAVNRQVPQAWGHARRPVVVAARYGFRLGVAPATILTTWVWWAALVLAASVGVAASATVAAVFVVVRTAVTLAVTVGVSDGRAMAARMARVVAARGVVARSGAVCAVAGAAVALVVR